MSLLKRNFYPYVLSQSNIHIITWYSKFVNKLVILEFNDTELFNVLSKIRVGTHSTLIIRL